MRLVFLAGVIDRCGACGVLIWQSKLQAGSDASVWGLVGVGQLLVRVGCVRGGHSAGVAQLVRLPDAVPRPVAGVGGRLTSLSS